jgi:hypothetical protein
MGGISGPVVASSATGRQLAMGPPGPAGPAGANGPTGPAGPAGANGFFSPVSLIKQILASGYGGNDEFVSTGGSFTAGVSFLIYDSTVPHFCTGVRLLWPGEATTLEAKLWSAFRGAGTLIGTVDFAAPAGGTSLVPLDLSASFATPLALIPGVFYVISYSDVGGSPEFWQIANNGVTTFGASVALISIASPIHLYGIYPQSDGIVSPFAMFYTSGSSFPNQGSNYQAVEPVLV